MADQLRVGIVGASGWMAGALAVGVEYEQGTFDQEARQGVRNKHSVVTALCDLNASALESTKQELGLVSAACYTSIETMLESDELDGVIIVVPNFLHVELALKTLAAGKHLFLEKPFATTWEGAQRLSAAVDASNVTTKLDYILMHYDEQERLRALVEQGAFGELASVHFTYRHPIQAGQSAGQVWKLSREKSGGAIPMGICHAISMAVYQVGSAPERVICTMRPAKLRTFDYPTQVDLLICFENGVVGLVQGNIDFAEKYDARHTIIGTGGQFDYSPFNPMESRVAWSSKPLGREYSNDPEFAHHHLDSGDVWKHQCSRTVQEWVKYALKGQKDPLLGLESTLVRRVESVIWAAEASAKKNGTPVDISQFSL